MVDIIVAVNSITEDTVTCLDRLLACTDLNRHRLLLVAYGNNIDNVVTGLHKYNSYHTVVLRTENTHSAISAMAQGAAFGGRNDFVLCDTEVLVTPYWLEKILAMIKDRPETACVFPRIIDLDKGDNEQQSVEISHNYPIVAEGTDSLVFIKRDAYNMVGGLDTAGFFDRCVKAGFCNYLADDTICYLNRLPYDDEKTSILFILGVKPEDEREYDYNDKWLFLKSLFPMLSQIHHVYTAVREKNDLVISDYEDSFQYRFTLSFNADSPITTVKEVDDIFKSVLRKLDIDMVHVIDTKGIGFDVFTVAAMLNIPIYATIFDYQFMCPNELILRANGTPCYLAIETKDCKNCLSKTCGIVTDGDFRQGYLQKAHEALSKCELIFAPSMSMKYYLNKAFADFSNRISIITCGRNYDLASAAQTVVEGRNKKQDKNNIKVGYFSIEDKIREHKTSSAKQSVIQRIMEATELIDVDLVPIDIIDENTASKVDVLLYLPDYPVAYGCVLLETIRFGIPIITVETGGISEQMQQYTHGFTVKSDDVIRGVRDILISLEEDKSVLMQKKILCGHTRMKSAGEMLEEYELHYEAHKKTVKNYTYYENIDENLLNKAYVKVEKVQEQEPEKKFSFSKMIKSLLEDAE